jgi:large subunit ribosomal protein L28
MAKRCQLSGKGPRAGQNVSHSNRKTKRRFDPNLQRVHMRSEALGRSVPMRVSTRLIRTVQKHGGIDAWLLQTRDAELAPEALRLKRRVQKALSG